MCKRLYEVTIGLTGEKFCVWSADVSQIKDAFDQMDTVGQRPKFDVSVKLCERQ